MKKIIVALVVVFMLLTVSCSPVRADYGSLPVTQEDLPSDSKVAGSYYATFCNRGICWDDFGSFKPSEVIFSAPHVHTAFLVGDMARLDLAAKPGYTWEYREGNLFERSGYFLVKVR